MVVFCLWVCFIVNIDYYFLICIRMYIYWCVDIVEKVYGWGCYYYLVLVFIMLISFFDIWIVVFCNKRFCVKVFGFIVEMLSLILVNFCNFFLFYQMVGENE